MPSIGWTEIGVLAAVLTVPAALVGLLTFFGFRPDTSGRRAAALTIAVFPLIVVGFWFSQQQTRSEGAAASEAVSQPSPQTLAPAALESVSPRAVLRDADNPAPIQASPDTSSEMNTDTKLETEERSPAKDPSESSQPTVASDTVPLIYDFYLLGTSINNGVSYINSVYFSYSNISDASISYKIESVYMFIDGGLVFADGPSTWVTLQPHQSVGPMFDISRPPVLRGGERSIVVRWYMDYTNQSGAVQRRVMEIRRSITSTLPLRGIDEVTLDAQR